MIIAYLCAKGFLFVYFPSFYNAFTNGIFYYFSFHFYSMGLAKIDIYGLVRRSFW